MAAEKVDFLESNAYVSSDELIEGLLLREEDYTKKNKPLYSSLIKEVFQELNLTVIRQTERMLLPVNKSLQCVDMPPNFLDWSSIGVANQYGKFSPLVINQNINTDIIDIGSATTCGCGCGCSSSLCSNVTNYELITSIVSAQMPDNTYQDFTATARKKVFNDGRFVREITTPTQIFVDGVHTETILQTTTEFLCNLDVLPCGCIAPTPKNEELIFGFTDAVDIAYDCGCPVAIHSENAHFYKVSSKGNRVQLPGNFPYDNVLVRFYAIAKTKDLRIPYMAQKAVRFGIKAEQTTFSAPGSKENITWLDLYENEKENLSDKLNRLKLSDFYAHLLQKRKVV